MAHNDFVLNRLGSVLRATGLGKAVSATRSLLSSAAAPGPTCREPYVQNVTANFNIPEEAMAQIGAG